MSLRMLVTSMVYDLTKEPCSVMCLSILLNLSIVTGILIYTVINMLGDKYFNANADVMGYFPREFHSIMREAGKE